MFDSSELASLASAFAPTGVLRASINLGNPILAGRDNAGNAAGVSIDMATELARWLNVPVQLQVYETAAKSVEVVSSNQADIGFFAIDPLRGAEIAFSAAYILIEGAYLVRESSPFQRNEEVDHTGHTVMVGKGSAYDLYLTREIKAATILRAPSSPAVVDEFIDQRADVAAGVKQQLEADAKRIAGLRLLPGRFMVIQQAMGVNKSRGEAAASALRRFVEAMKASGFVTNAMQRHGIQGASVAPAAT
jgi:polar amino acid transport system substrate-binding protein